MAFTKGIATKGYRGMIGGTLVFKKWGENTVVAAAPERGSKAPSMNQLAHQNRFRLASFYAKRTMFDAALLAEYRTAGLIKGIANVRNVMMADYFSSPEILECKMVESDPLQPGPKLLRILAIAYVRVTAVTVSVTDPGGMLLESGNALLNVDTQNSMYEFQNDANLFPGVSFQITATGLTGNVTSQSFVYQV